MEYGATLQHLPLIRSRCVLTTLHVQKLGASSYEVRSSRCTTMYELIKRENQKEKRRHGDPPGVGGPF